MKLRLILICAGLFVFGFSYGQDKAEYSRLVDEAAELYKAQSFEKSAEIYETAFEQLGGKAYPNDRYNAACSYALAEKVESAFHHLFYLAENPGIKYRNLWHISTDTDLDILHTDSRWAELMVLVRANKAAYEVGLNRPLVAILDTVLQTDQRCRREYRAALSEYGPGSAEVKASVQKVLKTDSVNLIKVRQILDEYGWLGPETIGKPGSNALFLVIQHADLESQLKYLPMMRRAVGERKANGGALALLEDRTALRQGEKQVYGSQIGTDSEAGEKYVMPLIEPEQVNERRAAVGLSTIEEYVKKYGIDWNVKAHKRQAAKRAAEKQ